jgi:hypothetical protein
MIGDAPGAADVGLDTPGRTAGMLAERMRDYLDSTPPQTYRSARCGPTVHSPEREDGVVDRPYRLHLRSPSTPRRTTRTCRAPAVEAVGLPASRPASKDAPAGQGVRLHDLRPYLRHASAFGGHALHAGIEVVRAQLRRNNLAQPRRPICRLMS